MRPDSDGDSARERLIAECAYYRAQKRGFVPGFALEDWLASEALVDFELAHALAHLSRETLTT